MGELNQKGMNYYVAPEGYVFEYKEPRMATIKEVDGTITTKQEHLNVKYLALGRFDSIDNYTIVPDPKVKKEV
jgi:hypothetical protein